MKKIIINCIIEKDKTAIWTKFRRYRIFLDSGSVIFSNKKKAGIFQAALNTYINNTFYELNSIYAELIYIYRKSWVFTDPGIDDAMKTNFRAVEIEIHRLFRSSYRGCDSAFYSLNDIESLCNVLQNIILDLVKYYTCKKNWQGIKEININEIQLKRILTELLETCEPGPLGKPFKKQ